MECCRFCGSERIVKNGVILNKQRYECKDCGRNPRKTDKREYTRDEKIKILKSYLNGVGFRAIGRIFDISLSGVIYTIKKYGKKLQELKKKEFSEKEVLEVLEADELFTYVKKK